MRNWNLAKKCCTRWWTAVFSVPMRNWNMSLVIIIPLLSPFSAYLWGIETNHVSRPCKIPSGFSAYLWGIETNLRKVGSVGFPEVFSVPMRNWNPHSRYIERNWSGFSAYLWGIETRRWWQWQTRKSRSFQRTYEELKLIHGLGYTFNSPPFSAYLWGIETDEEAMREEAREGFQRTYEELKLFSSAWLFQFSSRFQRTYEELKQLLKIAKEEIPI